LSGSASGASSRTCSTISSIRVAPNPCHPPDFQTRVEIAVALRKIERRSYSGWAGRLRSLRVRSRDTRLAVMIATAPLANSTRRVGDVRRAA